MFNVEKLVTHTSNKRREKFAKKTPYEGKAAKLDNCVELSLEAHREVITTFSVQSAVTYHVPSTRRPQLLTVHKMLHSNASDQGRFNLCLTLQNPTLAVEQRKVSRPTVQQNKEPVHLVDSMFGLRSKPVACEHFRNGWGLCYPHKNGTWTWTILAALT